MRELGLEKLALFRSSRSGGWHLYVFLDRTFNSNRLSTLLRTYLRKNGFEIKNGVLEVFPSGNALRFPLQSGFAFLDNDCQVRTIREQLTLEEAVIEFVRVADQSINDAEGLLQKIERWLSSHDHKMSSHEDNLGASTVTTAQTLSGQISEKNDPAMKEFEQMVADAHDQMHDDRYRRGRQYWLNGLTSKNQRHEAILTVGYFLWFGDPSLGIPRLAGKRNAAQRERLLRMWIEERHNGHCRHINRNKWKAIEQDIDRAVNWERDQSHQLRIPYLLTERLLDRQQETLLTVDQLERANEKREEEAREKIADAVCIIQEKNEKLSQRAIARVSGCSRNTVKKHADLWLSCGSGDLSSSPVGGVSVSSGSKDAFLISLVPTAEGIESVISVSEEIVVCTFIPEHFSPSSGSRARPGVLRLGETESAQPLRQLKLMIDVPQKPDQGLRKNVGVQTLSNSS